MRAEYPTAFMEILADVLIGTQMSLSEALEYLACNKLDYDLTELEAELDSQGYCVLCEHCDVWTRPEEIKNDDDRCICLDCWDDPTDVEAFDN